jgi:hypothetical protein
MLKAACWPPERKPRGFRSCRAARVGALLLAAAGGACAESSLAPFADAAAPRAGLPASPWVFAGVPGQKVPATRFLVAGEQGQAVLTVEADGSYGNLVHRLPGVAAGELSWRWRVERPLQAADLRTRAGDDVALKVCALFDLPRERVPFVERQLLRLAEGRIGEPLPNATLCYAFDPGWPSGSVVPNAYSRRVRYITLGAAGAAWQRERRNLAADFLQAFGDESSTVPALLAIAVGADADNTGGRSLGAIAELELRPSPAR